MLPVIDLTGALYEKADLDCSKPSNDIARKVTRLVEDFHARRSRIHRDLLFTEDIGEKLLARISASDAPLTPSYDPLDRTLVTYNTVLNGRVILDITKKLVDSGLLTPSFFDRFHFCNECGASQFNVREECPSCHSSNLGEESFIHHFKCAYQGPESDFHVGDSLICPKCSKDLSHFGRDYDKPGTMIICAGCGHTTSEPKVGFICLNCGSHADGDKILTRDISSYTLTENAIKFLEAGHAFLGLAQQTLRFADLPLDLVVALNNEERLFNEEGTSFVLLELRYQNNRDIEREHGAQQFKQVRGLFLEILRNAMAGNDKVVMGQSYDFALLKKTTPEKVRLRIETVIEQAAGQLRLDLGVAFNLFGPQDLS